jgi:hypothetical protein
MVCRSVLKLLAAPCPRRGFFRLHISSLKQGLAEPLRHRALGYSLEPIGGLFRVRQFMYE